MHEDDPSADDDNGAEHSPVRGAPDEDARHERPDRPEGRPYIAGDNPYIGGDGAYDSPPDQPVPGAAMGNDTDPLDPPPPDDA